MVVVVFVVADLLLKLCVVRFRIASNTCSISFISIPLSLAFSVLFPLIPVLLIGLQLRRNTLFLLLLLLLLSESGYVFRYFCFVLFFLAVVC